MKSTFRLSMDWLHTWTGVVFGWLMFAMFLTGTAALFRNETTVWMTPEHRSPATMEQALAIAEARLRSTAPRAAGWTIVLPDERQPSVQVQVRKGDESVLTARTALTATLAGREILDPSTGDSTSLRRTRGGDLFYNFHHRLEQPSNVGWWFTGSAAVIMLACLVSGIIIHRRIFKDFFTFRPWANLRLSWLDAHTVIGVIALPFHLMITYTGVAPMLITVMAPPIVANYAEHRSLPETLADYRTVRSTFTAERRLKTLHGSASGVEASLLPLARFTTQASTRWNGGRAGLITVSHPGDANAVVEVERHFSGQLAYQPEKLFFNGATGRLLGSSAPTGPAWTTFSVMWGLHEGKFGGPGLRWLYFLLGLLSSTMIASGLVFWTIRRQPKHAAASAPSFGQRLVERLNVGVIIGLPIAMAALFWANRLLPADLARRDVMESWAFYGVWVAMVAVALLRQSSRAWSEGAALAACAFGAVPVLNALTTDRWLVPALAQGDGVTAGFDATMLAIALLFAAIARRLARREAPGLAPGLSSVAVARESLP